MATKLQLAMIDKIARSDYTTVNGAVPKTLEDIGWVWANCVIEDSEDKGVFTSLIKAGLAKHSGHTGEDAAVTLTEAGFAVFTENQGK